MGMRSYIKNTLKDNSNVKSWSSWDAIKDNAHIIGSLVKDIKDPSVGSAKASAIPQTFEQMVTKLGLSAADLQKQMTQHLWVSFLCAILGIGAFGWTIFIFSKGMLLSGLVGLSLTALMFSLAFLENFRYFLVKQKRLNCTVGEWFTHLFSKRGK